MQKTYFATAAVDIVSLEWGQLTGCTPSSSPNAVILCQPAPQLGTPGRQCTTDVCMDFQRCRCCWLMCIVHYTCSNCGANHPSIDCRHITTTNSATQPHSYVASAVCTDIDVDACDVALSVLRNKGFVLCLVESMYFVFILAMVCLGYLISYWSSCFAPV